MIKDVRLSKEFRQELKRLSKKYRSLPDDFKTLFDSLLENPEQGVALPDKMRKIRLAITSKGKGKSGGARVIIRFVLAENVLRFLYIYDKNEMEDVSREYLLDVLYEMDN